MVCCTLVSYKCACLGNGKQLGLWGCRPKNQFVAVYSYRWSSILNQSAAVLLMWFDTACRFKFSMQASFLLTSLSSNLSPTSFLVWNPTEMILTVLPKYFKHASWDTFQKQLNLYGEQFCSHSVFESHIALISSFYNAWNRSKILLFFSCLVGIFPACLGACLCSCGSAPSNLAHFVYLISRVQMKRFRD